MDLDLLRQALDAGVGWYGIAAAAVVLLIRLYRSAPMQAIVPLVMQWRRLRPWARLTLVFAAALLSAWVAALIAGQGPLLALGMAIPVAIAAIGSHEVTKTVGYVQTQAAVAKNLGYRPGAIRTALQPVIPIDRNAMRRARVLSESAEFSD